MPVNAPEKPTVSSVWYDFENVEKAIRQMAINKGQPNVMPTREELNQGYPGIIHQIKSRHGGLIAVAQRMGMAFKNHLPEHILDSSLKKPMGYWTKERIRDAIKDVARLANTNGVMPTKSQFSTHGYSGAWRAMQNKFGTTINAVKALRLRLAVTPTESHSAEVDWSLDKIALELKEFNLDRGADENEMPSDKALRDADKRDLAIAIERQGGYVKVRSALGMKGKRRMDVKPSGYWQNDDNLVKEVLLAAEEAQTMNVPPLRKELEALGRSDLEAAIRSRGGRQVVKGVVQAFVDRLVQHQQVADERKDLVVLRPPAPDVPITRKSLTIGEIVLVHDVSVVKPAIALRKHDGEYPKPYAIVVGFMYGDMKGESVVPYGTDRKHHLQWCYAEDLGDQAVIKLD